jgi:hypothetical protein
MSGSGLDQKMSGSTWIRNADKKYINFLSFGSGNRSVSKHPDLIGSATMTKNTKWAKNLAKTSSNVDSAKKV